MYDKCGHAFTNKDRPETVNAEQRKIAFERTFTYFRNILA